MAPEALDGAAIMGDIHAVVIDGVNDPAVKGFLERKFAVNHVVVKVAAFLSPFVFRFDMMLI